MSVRNSATKKELRILRAGLLLLLLLMLLLLLLPACLLFVDALIFGVVGLFISPLNTFIGETNK